MAFEYIQSSDLLDAYHGAQKFMKPLFEPFDEFERISRNKPHPGIDKSLPKVTDGTLAALIQEQPKRVIQQIPTGKVKSDDEWLGLVAGYIYEHEILKHADHVAALIQKCWALNSKALTYGSQPAYVQFLNRGDYFGTDFVLPYIKDVYLEPGKLSDRDSNVIMLRTWWSKNQLQALIAKEQMLGKSAKSRGDKYEAGWDMGKLTELIETGGKQKDQQSATPSERDKQLSNGFYEIVHVFQNGIGANFYSFSPLLPTEGNLLRTKKNPDPRGIMPIHYMYADIDLSNPLGRGSIEKSGGVQNLLDSEMQSYQYMRALLMNPPVKKRGNISNSVIKYRPGAIWDMGNSPENVADVSPVDLSTRTLEQFPSNYGLMKSQILNLNSGGNDNAISASVGDVSSSKTQAGVQANQARLGVSDNYMRKQFETWWGDVSETMINLYFAERSGTQELQLDKETALKVDKVAPGTVSPDRMIRIDYDSETPKLKFEVDASTSSTNDNMQQLEALSGLLERIEASPILQQIAGTEKIAEVWNGIVMASGVENPEKLKVETTDENGQPVQGMSPQVTPEMVQQMVQEGMQQVTEQLKSEPKPLAESLSIKFTDLPDDAKRQILIQELGIESNDAMPTEIDNALKVHDAQIKDQQAKNQEMQAERSHSLAASDAALRVAQAEDNSAKNDRDHEFAKEQAKKPQPKAAK